MIDRRRPARPFSVPTWAVALLAVLGACLPGITPANGPASRQAALTVVPSPVPATAVVAAAQGLASVALASEPRLGPKDGDRPTAPEDRSPPSARLIGLWLVPPRTAAHPWPLVPRAVTRP